MTPAENTALEQPAGSDRLRISIKILLVAVYVVLAWALAIALLINRNDALHQGQQRSEMLAFILADHLLRTVSGVDTSLSQLVHVGSRVGGPSAGNEAWQSLLEAAKSGVSGIAALGVVDE